MGCECKKLGYRSGRHAVNCIMLRSPYAAPKSASNSEGRKRATQRTAVDDPVTVVVRALDPVVPNTNGIIWNYQHEDGEVQPVTLTDAARDVVAALGDAGLLS